MRCGIRPRLEYVEHIVVVEVATDICQVCHVGIGNRNICERLGTCIGDDDGVLNDITCSSDEIATIDLRRLFDRHRRRPDHEPFFEPTFSGRSDSILGSEFRINVEVSPWLYPGEAKIVRIAHDWDQHLVIAGSATFVPVSEQDGIVRLACISCITVVIRIDIQLIPQCRRRKQARRRIHIGQSRRARSENLDVVQRDRIGLRTIRIALVQIEVQYEISHTVYGLLRHFRVNQREIVLIRIVFVELDRTAIGVVPSLETRCGIAVLEPEEGIDQARTCRSRNLVIHKDRGIRLGRTGRYRLSNFPRISKRVRCGPSVTAGGQQESLIKRVVRIDIPRG